MTPEVLKALAVIAEFCLQQNNCGDCPLKGRCSKCHVNGKSRPSCLGSKFRTGRSVEKIITT